MVSIFGVLGFGLGNLVTDSVDPENLSPTDAHGDDSGHPALRTDNFYSRRAFKKAATGRLQ